MSAIQLTDGISRQCRQLAGEVRQWRDRFKVDSDGYRLCVALQASLLGVNHDCGQLRAMLCREEAAYTPSPTHTHHEPSRIMAAANDHSLD